MDGDITRTRRTNWDASWKGQSLGLVDEVFPDIDLVLKPIRVGTLGPIDLDERVEALKCQVKIQVREIALAVFQQLCPWYGGTGSIPGVPLKPGQRLYEYAGALVLHPHDLPATDLSEDLNFVKAVPVTPPAKLKRDGTKEDVFEIVMHAYPDWGTLQAAEPELRYFYIGPIPE
jgi:hypothetical protein